MTTDWTTDPFTFPRQTDSCKLYLTYNFTNKSMTIMVYTIWHSGEINNNRNCILFEVVKHIVHGTKNKRCLVKMSETDFEVNGNGYRIYYAFWYKCLLHTRA